MSFKKTIHNPTGKIKSDCVIRAISRALNKPWLETYDELCTIGRKLYTVPNDIECVQEYLRHHQKIPVKHIVSGKTKRLTVKDVCSLRGTYVVRIAKHITVVINGECEDTYDCTQKSAYIIWKVKA